MERLHERRVRPQISSPHYDLGAPGLSRFHVSAENPAQNGGGRGGGSQKAAGPSSSAHSAFQPQRSD